MKQIVLGVALLLVISTTNATPLAKHNTEHNILSTSLPVSLQASIKKQYAGYWITELVQEGDGKHAKYFLTLENGDQILHLRSSKAASWLATGILLKDA